MDGGNNKCILVCDFGKNGIDVTLSKINNNNIQILACEGNSKFRSSDFDTRLMQYSLHHFKKEHNIKDMNNILNDNLEKLKISCEIAKKILSIDTLTHIEVVHFYNNINLCIPLTRQKFENICCDLFLISMAPIYNIINECANSTNNIDNIDEIILIGDMTKIPKIKKMIITKFNKIPKCYIKLDGTITANIHENILTNNLNPLNTPKIYECMAKSIHAYLILSNQINLFYPFLDEKYKNIYLDKQNIHLSNLQISTGISIVKIMSYKIE